MSRLDPVTLETMFGIQKTGTTKASMKMASFFGKGHEGILDPKKAHNFGIQLRALSLTRNEVCEALLEGKLLLKKLLVPLTLSSQIVASPILLN